MIQNDKYMVIVSRNAKDGDENFVGCFSASLVKWQVIEMRHCEFLFSAHLSFSPPITLTKHRQAQGELSDMVCSAAPRLSPLLVLNKR